MKIERVTNSTVISVSCALISFAGVGVLLQIDKGVGMGMSLAAVLMMIINIVFGEVRKVDE